MTTQTLITLSISRERLVIIEEKVWLLDSRMTPSGKSNNVNNFYKSPAPGWREDKKATNKTILTHSQTCGE
jgi:hypothetical protein